MIKTISNFISSLDQEFRSLGLKPKDGLHILLKTEVKDSELQVSKEFDYAYTRKKEQSPDSIKLLNKAAVLSRLSWCVNTNKCFDLPIKAIHSCSPYCIAIKKENLSGGEKYKSNSKSQVYERINSYFNKAIALIEDEANKQLATVFKLSLSSEALFNQWLELIPEYKEVKDSEYVIFYLDVPVEKYAETNRVYLADKLFNTNEYNTTINEETFGTSDFFNGYPTKKPFLSHQSASFDIANRITAKEAKNLFDFQDIMSRGILPKPLPIFIYEDELNVRGGKSLRDASIRIFKREAEAANRIGYKEIIEELYENHRDNFGNYYLLFYDRGEIKDFDFVSKFEYLLEDEAGKKWEIKDFFDGGNGQVIKNVFHFQQAVLKPVFNNSLITETKTGAYQYKYFDDIESKYCKSDLTYLQILKYRKAFYDFIYKSKRQSITSSMFNEIMQDAILEDLRLDDTKNGFHTQGRNIRQKLNIWFSITNNFINAKNNQTMGNKLIANREFIVKLAKGEADISTDEEYAFAAGQVIYYLLSKSKTADRSYKRLEPFMQQVHSKELNKSISRLFDSYKHETFSSNFRNPFSQVLAYETSRNVRDLTPTILSGIFSANALFSDKESKEETEILVDEENIN